MNDRPPVRYDEMDSRRTTERVLERMTNPEILAKKALEKEEKEMNEVQSKRIGL